MKILKSFKKPLYYLELLFIIALENITLASELPDYSKRNEANDCITKASYDETLLSNYLLNSALLLSFISYEKDSSVINELNIICSDKQLQEYCLPIIKACFTEHDTSQLTINTYIDHDLLMSIRNEVISFTQFAQKSKIIQSLLKYFSKKHKLIKYPLIQQFTLFEKFTKLPNQSSLMNGYYIFIYQDIDRKRKSGLPLTMNITVESLEKYTNIKP
jgi:hypothetical protein